MQEEGKGDSECCVCAEGGRQHGRVMLSGSVGGSGKGVGIGWLVTGRFRRREGEVGRGGKRNVGASSK